MIYRRTFLTGLLAAPIIVRAGIIMPVRPIDPTDGFHEWCMHEWDQIVAATGGGPLGVGDWVRVIHKDALAS
jgi:hypothetical protein